MRAKGGAAGSKMRPLLDTLNDTQSIEKKRDVVICCLISYLGERQEDLFHDCQECEDYTDNMMKVIVIHNIMAEEDPSDVSIVIEGNQVMEGCGSRTKACVLLMGLIYALNLEYPKELKNTFDTFQKLFLELDGAKLLNKVHGLKNKLMQCTHISPLVPRCLIMYMHRNNLVEFLCFWLLKWTKSPWKVLSALPVVLHFILCFYGIKTLR